MNGTMGIVHHRGSRTVEIKLGPGLPPGQKVAFLFFEAFFSFVNTKEKKAYSLPPGSGGTPRRGEADTLYDPVER